MCTWLSIKHYSPLDEKWSIIDCCISRYDTLSPCCFNAWPSSQTVVKHWTNMGPKSHVWCKCSAPDENCPMLLHRVFCGNRRGNSSGNGGTHGHRSRSESRAMPICSDQVFIGAHYWRQLDEVRPTPLYNTVKQNIWPPIFFNTYVF